MAVALETSPLVIPDVRDADLRLGSKTVHLSNLQKVFWPESGLTKRDLLQYYADVSSVLLPHLAGRAMVMKRYPNGVPVTWDEVTSNIRIEDFRLDNARDRLARRGDLWSPMLASRGRFRLEALL